MIFILKRSICTFIYFGSAFLSFLVLWKILISQSGDRSGNNSDLLTCDDFQYLSFSSVLREGWTKIVYKGSWRGVPVAVKTVNEGGHAIKVCKNLRSECVASLRQGLIREESILRNLDHPNIVKLYGSCFQHTSNYSLRNGVMLVQLGEPLDSFSLVQKDFQRRLELAKGLSSLLLYLGTFPSGGILLPDLRLQQFVVAEGRFKLCDVDDLVFGDKTCIADSECDSSFNRKEQALSVPCSEGRCRGLNDSLNVWRACRNILTYLLSFGSPKHIEGALQRILECKKGIWSSKQLDVSLQSLLTQFSARR